MGTSRNRWLTTISAVIGAVLLAHTVASWWAVAQLRDTVRAQRERGLPLSSAALFPDDLPEEQNALIPLRKAFALMEGDAAASVRQLVRYRDDSLTRGNSPFALWNVDATRGKELRQQLEEPAVVAALDSLVAAAELPDCRFMASPDSQLLPPHLPGTHDGVRLLLLRGWLSARFGEWDAALSDVELALRLSEHLKQSPILVTQVVRATCEEEVIRRAAGIVISGRGHIPAARLSSMRKVFLGSLDVDRTALVRALDGERIQVASWMVHNVLSSDAPGQESGPTKRDRRHSGYVWRPWLATDLRAFLLEMELCRRQVRAGRWPIDLDRGAGFPSSSLTRRAGPPISQGIRAVLVGETLLRLAGFGLAIEESLARQGHLPGSLADLADGIATEDAFGNAIIYRVSAGSRYTLYSPGPDGVDDDGATYTVDGELADCVWPTEEP